VLRRLRQEGNWIPILLLTQVGKPGNAPWRWRRAPTITLTNLRSARAGGAHPGRAATCPPGPARPLSAANRLACGSLSMDRVSHRVLLDETELTLTPKAVIAAGIYADPILTNWFRANACWMWSGAGTNPVGTRAVDTAHRRVAPGAG